MSTLRAAWIARVAIVTDAISFEIGHALRFLLDV
jgi:hypothetical protein